jgi:hypothetical protein
MSNPYYKLKYKCMIEKTELIRHASVIQFVFHGLQHLHNVYTLCYITWDIITLVPNGKELPHKCK